MEYPMLDVGWDRGTRQSQRLQHKVGRGGEMPALSPLQAGSPSGIHGLGRMLSSWLAPQPW